MLHKEYQSKQFWRRRHKNIGDYQNFSYMIPICSVLAFLALSLVSIPPNLFYTNTVSATDNSDIATYADSPSASFSYSGSLDLSNSGYIADGNTSTVITMNSNITVKADLINNYNLQISSSSSSLSGPTTINSTTSEVASANNLADNTWGYSWNNGNYKAIPTANTTIANDGVNSSGSVSYTKTLSFAAKFNKQAEAGHYKAQVTLSLAAAPKSLTTYTLSYNNNGGGTVPSQQTISNYNDSHTFTINSTAPTRSGYEFAGYATSSGGNVAYQPGGTITLQASTPSQTLYAKWNQIYTRTLSFDANGGSGAPSSVSCSSTSTSCSVTLPATKPTRTGYTFLGWGTSSTATSASYQPSGSRTLSADATVWAVWEATIGTWSDGTSSGITYMQDITTGTSASSFCKSNLPTYASITLKDKRDENSYTIVKMSDGQCWMTQNLTLMNKTISSTDSDMAYGSFIVPASDISKFKYDNTASNAYYDTQSAAGATGYYSWCAATAGSCSSATTDGVNASSSICPKGWKLPTGNSSGDFKFLIAAEGIANSEAGSTKLRGMPYNFAYTGYILNGSIHDPLSSGYWWSSTASSDSSAYLQNLYSSSVNVSSISRLCGYAVRCIAK